jgi:hypothetical protein
MQAAAQGFCLLIHSFQCAIFIKENIERERNICCICFGAGKLTQLLWFVGENPSLALDAMRQSHSINHGSSPNLSLSSPLLHSALVDTDASNSMHAVDHHWIQTQVLTTRWWILFQCLPLHSPHILSLTSLLFISILYLLFR